MRVCLKGYIRCKTIFCHKVALYEYLTNFFDLNQKYFVLEIFRFLCFCEIYRFQNLWGHHRHCYIMEVILMFIYFECYVLPKWNLVKCYFAVWKTFLTCFWLNAVDWKLFPRLFYFFIKMTVKQDRTIFNSRYLPFYIVPYSPFQKDDTLESWHNLNLGYWVIEAGL